MEKIRFTAAAERLLQILSDNGTWMTRAQLSAAYGRTLGTYDFALLEDLERAGMLEINKATIGQVKPKYEYRAK